MAPEEKKEKIDKVDKIVLNFKFKRATPNTKLFEEMLGEQEWSDKGTAVGALYVNTQALEMLGVPTPTKLRVTIEPVQ